MSQVRLFAFGAAIVAVTTVVPAWNAFGQSDSKKRAPRPTFDRREVEQTFFPDARTALVGKRPGHVAATNRNVPGNGNGVPATTPNDRNPAGGGFRWSRLISAETLADEVKSYPQQLAAVVKTPSQFQGKGAREARRYFSTLAAVFAIIAQYDGDVRWKNQAAAARELFARAGFNSKSDNENVYNEAKQRTADLTLLIRGETLSAPPNVESKPNFDQQVANRPPLMWRMDRAQRERLSVWTANRADFTRNLAAIKHEAEMVAALAHVIQDASYTDADDETYRAFAQELQQAALELREAANTKNADAARTAAGKLSQACDQCHADYRGG
jgi:hypothetical protein